MALRKVSTNVEFIKWSEIEPGSVVRGYYIKTEKSANYDSLNHYIETVEGSTYGLNGNANLDRAMEQIRQGWYVEITYQGEVILEKGKFKGKKCHQFDVACDDDNIHSLFTGDAATRQADAQYEASEESSKPVPALAAPQSSPAPALAAPQASQPAPESAPTPAEPPKEAPKRKLFG